MRMSGNDFEAYGPVVTETAARLAKIWPLEALARRGHMSEPHRCNRSKEGVMPRHPNYVPHGVIPAVILPFEEDSRSTR